MAPPTDVPLSESPVHLLALIHLESADLARFEQYERIVLPLAREHGALVEQAVRTLDARLEVHLLTFPSRESLEAFRNADPRAAAQDLLTQSGAQVSVHEVSSMTYLPVLRPDPG